MSSIVTRLSLDQVEYLCSRLIALIRDRPIGAPNKRLDRQLPLALVLHHLVHRAIPVASISCKILRQLEEQIELCELLEYRYRLVAVEDVADTVAEAADVIDEVLREAR